MIIFFWTGRKQGFLDSYRQVVTTAATRQLGILRGKQQGARLEHVVVPVHTTASVERITSVLDRFGNIQPVFVLWICIMARTCWRTDVLRILLGLSCLTAVTTAKDCSGAPSCELGCVAIERVLHRYGVDASASVLLATPRLSNNYVLCYSRPLGQNKKSQIFCYYGPMDSLSGAAPRLAAVVDGLVTRFQAFVVDDKQYLTIFAVNRSPALYEVAVRENAFAGLTGGLDIGGQGAADSAVTISHHVGIFAASSGRYCRDGDKRCTSPAVTLINGRTGEVKRCVTIDIKPAEFVAAWTHGRSAFLALASLIPNDPHLYRVDLHRVTEPSATQCGLAYVQEIIFERPLCGLQSMEMIETVEGSYALTVVSRACPGKGGEPEVVDRSLNVLVKMWIPTNENFEVSPVEEIPGTSRVTNVIPLTRNLYVMQKIFEPSTIHAPKVPMGTGMMVTVRLNDRTAVSAATSANGDTYLTHVTSTGAVVIDWISCITGSSDQYRTSNYTLTRYSGNPYFESVTDVDVLNETMLDTLENSILIRDPVDSGKTALTRKDRDMPLYTNVSEELKSSGTLSNVTTTTAKPSAPAGPLHYEILIRDDLPVDQHMVHLPASGPYPSQMEFAQRSHTEPANFGLQATVQNGPAQPPQAMGPVPLQNGFGVPQNGQFNGQNGWQSPPTNPQQQQTIFYTPAMPGNGQQYPFAPQFGAPQQIPGGSTLAGYFTFPPVAIFAPIPNYPVQTASLAPQQYQQPQQPQEQMQQQNAPQFQQPPQNAGQPDNGMPPQWNVQYIPGGPMAPPPMNGPPQQQGPPNMPPQQPVGQPPLPPAMHQPSSHGWMPQGPPQAGHSLPGQHQRPLHVQSVIHGPVILQQNASQTTTIAPAGSTEAVTWSLPSATTVALVTSSESAGTAGSTGATLNQETSTAAVETTTTGAVVASSTSMQHVGETSVTALSLPETSTVTA